METYVFLRWFSRSITKNRPFLTKLVFKTKLHTSCSQKQAIYMNRSARKHCLIALNAIEICLMSLVITISAISYNM